MRILWSITSIYRNGKRSHFYICSTMRNFSQFLQPIPIYLQQHLYKFRSKLSTICDTQAQHPSCTVHCIMQVPFSVWYILKFCDRTIAEGGGGDLLVQISKKCSNRLPFVLVCNTTNWSNTNCRPRAKNFISIHQIVHWNWSLLNLHPLKINVGTNSSGWQ